MQIDRLLVGRLLARAQGERWGVSPDIFAAALEASAAHAFEGRAASATELARHVDSLRLEDLALACGCAAGDERAWDHFIREHRPALYRAAEAIDRTGGARELADSLYGDLFGLGGRSGERRSLFRYFHGRSSLTTWLRAVLAQRHLDRLRASRRLDPLPDDESSAAVPSAAEPLDPGRERFVRAMRRALEVALASLRSRDRLRLGCYYAENLTLAQIGRLVGEHEATVSRHLARTRRDVKAAIEVDLRQAQGFSEADIVQCFESMMADSGPLDLVEMLGPAGDRKTPAVDRSTG